MNQKIIRFQEHLYRSKFCLALFFASVLVLSLLITGCSKEDSGAGLTNSGRQISFTASSGNSSAETKSSAESADSAEGLDETIVGYELAGGSDFGVLTIADTPNDGFYRYTASSLSSSDESDASYEISTKTRYSGQYSTESGKKYERIDWEVGDKLTLWSDKARVVTYLSNNDNAWATYEILTSTIDGRKSKGTIAAENNGNGLWWDKSGGEHLFLGLYPDVASVGSGTFTIRDNSTQYGVAISDIVMPENQVAKCESVGSFTYLPDMNYAYMGTSAKSSPVNSLEIGFVPMFNAYEFRLLKDSDRSIVINKVTLTEIGVSGAYLSGNKCQLQMGGARSSFDSNPFSSYTLQAPLSHDASDFSTSISLTFADNSGSPISGVALDKTNPTSFTLLSLPRDITRLKLVLDLTIDGTAKQRTLELKKKNGDWVTLSKGRKLLISSMNISDIGYEIITPSEIVVENAATPKSKSFEIESYKIDRTSGVKTKLNISKIEYSAANPDGTNKEEWSTTPPSGMTSAVSLTNTTGTTYGGTINVDANSAASSDNRATRTGHLASRDNGKSSSSPEDLSLMETDGTERFPQLPVTANSYVVRKKGWYAFPVVYGNAIDGLKGSTIDGISYNNKDAYAPNYAPASRLYLTPFRNAIYNSLNTQSCIDNPYIHRDLGINPSGDAADLVSNFNVVVVWVDLPSGQNFISDLELVSTPAGCALSGVPYIRFRINENIQEGNAVIALRNSSNIIVWSWHIWVSDSDFTTKTVYHKENLSDASLTATSELLPFTLGYNAEDEKWLNERVWYMRFTQEISNEQKVVKIMQPILIESLQATSLFYQWGRKDPILGSSGLPNPVNKNHHSPSGYVITSDNVTVNTYTFSTGSNGNTGFPNFGLSIQNPHMFLYGTGGTPSNLFNYYGRQLDAYYNLWNAQQTTAAGQNRNTTGLNIPVIKTIYDPCPPGYSVPRAYVFTGGWGTQYGTTNFVYNHDYKYKERNWYGLEGFNNTEEYVSHFKGVFFYTNPTNQSTKTFENTIFIPSAAYRSPRTDNQLYYVGGGIQLLLSNASYRTHASGLPYTQNNYWVLGQGCANLFDSFYVYNDNWQPMGFQIIPMKN